MHIVLLEPLGIPETRVRELAKGLEASGHTFTYYDTRTEKDEELIERAKDADVVLISNLPLNRKVIEACPSLQLISVAFTGVDHVDLAACRERDIRVCNAAGYSTHAVAELAFGLAISVLRRLVPCDKATRTEGTKNGLVGYELYGKTFGIVGTGAIGLKTALIAKAFGCRVLAYSRSKKQGAAESGIEYTDLDTLLQEADIVSLHVPLTEETRQLIDARRLGLMKPSAVLINTARGPVVDNAALAQALREGKLGGAGVDVFEMEPPIPSDHPLVGAPNTVLAPHVAFATHEAMDTRAQIVFANVEKWLAAAPQNVIC
ncbi:2-hydroxyacid dehydrogenase [Paenibacillus sp. YN15]|uniref:2-hydroxyacid dehydrogenase n=1 Tax=Paenibacillus sp. YN15 TaxID=1742774 RepID=UPI000DCEC402|nr:2-hydroxyacid dehydrogenase [Paenibacillus sp. YN15]RAV00603.1 hydroxyacid dehydrogenase [Paenibacillus sp. YN15]